MASSKATEFQDWKQEHNKQYNRKEEERRKKNWLSTHKIVLEHNKKGLRTYRMALNQFADMDIQDLLSPSCCKSVQSSCGLGNTSTAGIRGRHHATTPEVKCQVKHFARTKQINDLPLTVDWNEKRCVTPVKNQGHCGSCWAFSATGALESHTAIKTRKLQPLSEQQLVDCSFENLGCSGGWYEKAFEYISRCGGLDTAKDYPYKGEQGVCHFKPSDAAAQCKGYYMLPPGDELALQEAVAICGPVCVSVRIEDTSFQKYDSGVFYEDGHDKPHPTHHAMLVVGYGTENRLDYWLVKNSWGDQWGENGYVKMARNKNNHWGIASRGCFPIV